MMTLSEQSGTCGSVSPGLVALDPNAGVPNGCTLHSETWSEGNCKLERVLTCSGTYSEPTTWGGRGAYTNKTTAVTRQVTSDGSRLEGVMTMEIDSTSGPCLSTYGMVAVRQ